ncbi:MAG: 7-cyano-7-deazaguanine synthase QueC [Candidatus Methylarchaceae archaeon HK02M1]|nr:7-cyano-7-deazaguanine synthase QueC [Candidatus Methylarchaceae archaeon HK02M1]
MKKALTIISGGIDSSTLLYKILNDRYEAYALTFVYGQKHSKEVEVAKDITSKLNIDHKVIDISSLQEILRSALTSPEINIPEVSEELKHYDSLKFTVVPNRNSIFLSIAVGYAISIRVNHVFYAAHFSDRGVYPDCREEFVEAFNHASRLATDNPDLVIEAPFIKMSKSEIVSLGTKLGVPYELTWSCYKGGEKHCGVCSSCRERKRAFQDIGIPDPTVYER